MNRLKPIILFYAVLFAGYSIAADNGTVEIVGKGEASAKPERVQLEVSVTSLCYEHSRDAKNANATLANKTVTVLKSYQRGNRDLVTASGGPTVRQSEYVFESGNNNRKLICERKWRATNTLILKTGSLEQVSDIQDALLTAINGAETVEPGVTAQTYAELSEPSFTLYPETEKKLRAEAQQHAWQDAKAQFDNFVSVCAFKNPRVSSVTQPTYQPIQARFAAPASEAAGSATPILPDSLRVSATWKFVWSFDPSSSCAAMY